jgi:hypothetical protein
LTLEPFQRLSCICELEEFDSSADALRRIGALGRSQSGHGAVLRAAWPFACCGSFGGWVSAILARVSPSGAIDSQCAIARVFVERAKPNLPRTQQRRNALPPSAKAS